MLGLREEETDFALCYADHQERTVMAARQKRESPILQLKIRGPGVRRGRIPVPDLIKICHEAQNAVTKQAEALEGRKTIHPGPTANVIQYECTLELMAIRPGSTTLQFGLAKPQMRLPFEDGGAFGAEVVSELAAVIKSLANGKKRSIDPGVLQGIYRLASVMSARRFRRFTGSHLRITATSG